MTGWPQASWFLLSPICCVEVSAQLRDLISLRVSLGLCQSCPWSGIIGAMESTGNTLLARCCSYRRWQIPGTVLTLFAVPLPPCFGHQMNAKEKWLQPPPCPELFSLQVNLLDWWEWKRWSLGKSSAPVKLRVVRSQRPCTGELATACNFCCCAALQQLPARGGGAPTPSWLLLHCHDTVGSCCWHCRRRNKHIWIVFGASGPSRHQHSS